MMVFVAQTTEERTRKTFSCRYRRQTGGRIYVTGPSHLPCLTPLGTEVSTVG